MLYIKKIVHSIFETVEKYIKIVTWVLWFPRKDLKRYPSGAPGPRNKQLERLFSLLNYTEVYVQKYNISM